MKGNNKTNRNQLYGHPDYKNTKACPLGVTVRGTYFLHGKTGNPGWKIKIVRAIPFGKLQKMWVVI